MKLSEIVARYLWLRGYCQRLEAENDELKVRVRGLLELRQPPPTPGWEATVRRSNQWGECVVYRTEEARVEARRRSWRESKRRARERLSAERKEAA